MIRALVISLCLASSAAAQTPVPTAVANDLRACIRDAHGFRDAARVGQLAASLQDVPNRRWTDVTEIAPGVFRISGSSTPTVIEIKLPDATGAAHCLAFGPHIANGQGALVADKFNDLSFMTGLVQAPTPPGMTRRYTVTGAPYQADLIALPGQSGDMVGFVFAGVPQNITTRELSSGDPSVTEQAVRIALSNALDVCLRMFFSRDTIEPALSAHGYEFGFSTGGSSSADIYFTADNAVSVRLNPGTCYIDTRYAGPNAAVRIAQDVLNRTAPGVFVYRTESHNGCPAFYGGPRIDPPVFLTIVNAQQKGRTTCIEDGTTRITVSVVG